MTRRSGAETVLLPVDPVVRAYDWGSRLAIPDLFGWPATDHPVAEVWFGAHCTGPSPLTSDRGRTLLDVIDEDPVAALGAATVDAMGPRLPFLLKVLSAEKPLSLQVHPSRSQARSGLAEETVPGVAISAARRNYRDDNHKPELLCALTDFWALNGFRPARQTARLFTALGCLHLPALRGLLRSRAGLRRTVEAVLTATPDVSRVLIDTALAGARAEVERAGEWHREAKLALTVAQSYPSDPGIVLALMLNLVHLRPGQSMFVPAGQLHAYVRGTGIELMASSDNVVRCGLTGKHVDVAEVLRIGNFSATSSLVAEPTFLATGESTYCAPVHDFALFRTTLVPGTQAAVTTTGAQIVLCVAGDVCIRVGDHSRALGPGDAVFVPDGQSLRLSGAGEVFRATTNVAGSA